MDALGLEFSGGVHDFVSEAERALHAASEAYLHGTLEMCRSCVKVAQQLVQDLDRRVQTELQHIATLRCVCGGT